MTKQPTKRPELDKGGLAWAAELKHLCEKMPKKPASETAILRSLALHFDDPGDALIGLQRLGAS